MNITEGFVYHIKDDYFHKANDTNLMKNKENGNYRPTYYCIKDKKNNLLWVIPMSTQVSKYQKIQDKQLKRYGKSLSIVIGKYDGKDSAFLIQNMFPITEKYINHIHTRNGNPVPVTVSLQKQIEKNVQEVKILIDKGKKVVFPDVQRLEKIMLQELQQENQFTKSPQKNNVDSRPSLFQKIQEIEKNNADNSEVKNIKINDKER